MKAISGSCICGPDARPSARAKTAASCRRTWSRAQLLPASPSLAAQPAVSASRNPKSFVPVRISSDVFRTAKDQNGTKREHGNRGAMPGTHDSPGTTRKQRHKAHPAARPEPPGAGLDFRKARCFAGPVGILMHSYNSNPHR
jgi:hypothetical protein